MHYLLLLLLPLFTAPDPPLRKIVPVTYNDRPHFRVTTRSATYYYDIAGGGFSAILDRNGNDWVSYRREPWGEYPASAASAYRGLPNMVFGGPDGGAGHPGHDKMESRVVGRNQIQSVSLSGEWGWQVTFYRRYVKIELTSAPMDAPYWFLYEGTPGGSYRPKTSWWATDLTPPSHTVPDHFAGEATEGQYRYLVFGTDDSAHSLFIAQQTPDTKTDHVSYLGNEEIGAAHSPDGMVVAGFGRAAEATPLLTGRQVFYLGLQPYNWTSPQDELRGRKRLTKLLRKQPAG